MSAPPLPRSGVLLVTNHLQDNPSGGREMLCKLNHDALRDIYAERLRVFRLDPSTGGAVGGVLKGYIDGVSGRTVDDVMQIVSREQIETMFVDGSNLGALVGAVKRRMPEVEVTTFFHNVEARFFWGSLTMRRTLHAAGVLVANYVAERTAVQFSDKLVCLSERDSRLLNLVYGRKATHVSPMALVDRAPDAPEADAGGVPEPFALFVGGTFYANRAGITWYARNVARQAPLPVMVVGKGFEALREELEVPGKVQVVGSVPSLSEWYRRAQFVIAPIFDGSGMKTKVAEALMYGKKVVGTAEAFSGYEGVAARAGWVCETPEEFATAMEQAHALIQTSFDPALRELYVASYSFTAARQRLRTILEN